MQGIMMQPTNDFWAMFEEPKHLSTRKDTIESTISHDTDNSIAYARLMEWVKYPVSDKRMIESKAQLASAITELLDPSEEEFTKSPFTEIRLANHGADHHLIQVTCENKMVASLTICGLHWWVEGCIFDTSKDWQWLKDTPITGNIGEESFTDYQEIYRFIRRVMGLRDRSVPR